MIVRDFFRKGKALLSNNLHLKVNKVKSFLRKFYRGQHQLTSTTDFNRYPELFSKAKDYAKSFDNSQLKILSYGCSTGEECFTLKLYFTHSTIIGADINKNNLREANKKNTFSDVKFILSTDENLKKEGKYNLIFCLSVLCRWDETRYVTNCEHIYPFKKFEQTIVHLSELLLPGGYLIVYNSNFRLEDTIVAEQFDIKPAPSVPPGFVFKFDVNNNRINEDHTHCIYQKKQ